MRNVILIVKGFINMVKADSLLEEIESLRKQLIKLVREKGYTDESTVKTSQQLDHVLNQYENVQNKDI